MKRDRTAEKLAKVYGVSPATVIRDAEFARKVNALTAVLPDAKRLILSDEVFSMKEVKHLAALSPKEQRRILEAVKSGKKPKDVLPPLNEEARDSHEMTNAELARKLETWIIDKVEDQCAVDSPPVLEDDDDHGLEVLDEVLRRLRGQEAAENRP